MDELMLSAMNDMLLRLKALEEKVDQLSAGSMQIPDIPDPPVFYRTEEAAKLLGCNPRRIGDMRKAGLLKGIRAGHGWRYEKAELEELAREYRGFDLSNTEKINNAAIEKRHSKLSKARVSR